jgi:predicted PurR-regulated permease PerM
MLSKNPSITLIIEQIDQLMNSKNESIKKENSMLDLHRKVDRIDQLLEKQNAENEKKNTQSISNVQKQHSNVKSTHLNVKSNQSNQTKQINHDAAKNN